MKKTYAGYIPDDWDVYKGSEISELITKGESPRWQGFGYQDSGPLFVTSENVRDGFLDVSKPKCIPGDFHEKLDRSKLKKNDILINLVGASVGRSCVYNISEPANINQAVCLLRLSNVIDVPWVSCFLQNPETIRRLLNLVGDGARANISLKDIRDFDYIFPPERERQKIAEILGACDEAIEAQERLIAQKQQRKKGLMQQLLTGKKRFPQFAGTVDWAMIQLCKVSTRITEKAGEQELDVLSITAGRGFVSQKEKFSKVIAGRNYGNYTVLRKGEFAYNKGNSDRFPQGCIYRLDEYEIGAVPNVFYSFRLDPAVTVCGFFVQLFKMGYQNKQLRAYINSGVRNDGLLNLNAKDFFRMKVPLPKIEEQQALADFFGDQDEEITLQQTKLEQLKQQKKGLMQQLLTGKVRVKV
jgi:type I restriction enzyme, S subunit